MMLAFGMAVAISPATAKQTLAIPTPFEVGESPAGNYLAALIAGATRDTGAAATFSREALRFDPRNLELLERAFVDALSNGNMPDAFRLSEQLVRRDPRNGLAQLALGVRAMKGKKYQEARTHFANGGPGRTRDITAILLTAWTQAGAGNGKTALATLDRLDDSALAVFRDYHAGLIADFTGNKAEAVRRMQAAYANEKNELRLVDAYARLMARQGDVEEAKRAYTAFDALLPRHPLVTAALADINAGKIPAPLISSATEGAAEVLYGLGTAGSRQHDELAVLIYLRLSLYLSPSNTMAIVTLADTYERLKQYEREIDVYDTIPENSPMRANAEIQMALTLDLLGKSEDATKYLTELVSDNPKDIDALTALANVQRSRKLYDEAVKSYTRVFDLLGKPDRSNWALFYFRGITFERLKQWPKAEADFRKALELYPDQPLVLNYLGYSWVDQGLNLDEAFKMLRRAVELRPTDGYIVDSLGWAHYRLGRYDEAVKELERAIDLKPSDPVINDHLGDAYWRVGRKLEASFQWNHARDLKPEAEDLDRILAKIAKGMLEDEKPAEAGNQQKKNGG